jgi:hypothetical protein
MPKLSSFVEMFKEVENDVCIVTETWTKSCEKTDQLLDDAGNVVALSCIRRDRVSSRGGGVAIVYDKGKIQACHARLECGDSEIVAAVCRRQAQRRRKVSLRT